MERIPLSVADKGSAVWVNLLLDTWESIQDIWHSKCSVHKRSYSWSLWSTRKSCGLYCWLLFTSAFVWLSQWTLLALQHTCWRSFTLYPELWNLHFHHSEISTAAFMQLILGILIERRGQVARIAIQCSITTGWCHSVAQVQWVLVTTILYTHHFFKQYTRCFSMASRIAELTCYFHRCSPLSASYYQHCIFDSCIRPYSSYIWRIPNLLHLCFTSVALQGLYGQTTGIPLRHKDWVARSAGYFTHLLNFISPHRLYHKIVEVS